MANTYDPIATQTFSGSAKTVTFTNISGLYTDLVLVFGGSASSGNIQIRFNSDTSTNYSQADIWVNTGSLTSGRETSVTALYAGDNIAAPVDGMSSVIAHFNNYSNSTTFKSSLIRTSNAAKTSSIAVGLWRSTSAITSITFESTGANFSSGSKVSLYGIKAA